MNKASQEIHIRLAEKFLEPAFSALQRSVFGNIQVDSPALEAVLESEKAEFSKREAVAEEVRAPMVRFGAYADDELVGWSCGWMERGGTYYMANSGVVPSRRRSGVYSKLLSASCEYALSRGQNTVRSQHSALNNPVIIAKLRHGFHVTGLTVSAQMGALVEMTLHLTQAREQLFSSRFVVHMPSSEATG